jgi:hypothetical protein
MTESDLDLDRSDDRLRAYLLGRLSDEDRHALEEVYFADEEVFDRLLDMQHDLVDAWARGALGREDRAAVEERLLDPSTGELRMRMAKALARHEVERRPQTANARTSHWFTGSLAAAAAVAVLGVSASIWLGVENMRLRRAVAPAPAPSSERSAPAPSSDAPQIAEVRLTPGVRRSEQAPRVVTLPSQARLVRLLLPTDETGPLFVVGIERAGAGRISTQAGLARSESGAVVVWVPVELLTPGDYEVLLWQAREATETLAATYLVRIRTQG